MILCGSLGVWYLVIKNYSFSNRNANIIYGYKLGELRYTFNIVCTPIKHNMNVALFFLYLDWNKWVRNMYCGLLSGFITYIMQIKLHVY